jgi:hypothetical protein
LLLERIITAVVTVHGDGRPPGVSEVTGFERRVDPSGRTISEGHFPVQPRAVEPLGVFGCSGRGDAPGFRDHSEAVGPVRLDVDVAGDAARSAFHVYSLAGGRGVEGRSTLQVLVYYFANAAAGWWQHRCVDDGPVCGPADGSTVFQGSFGRRVVGVLRRRPP